jgi:hypothetical protein
VRAVFRLCALLAAFTLLAACTSSGHSSPSTPPDIVHTQTVVHTRTPSASPTARISTGPTTVVAATSCPFIDQQTATDRGGMRLDRITVLHSGGKTVGCRLFALQHPTADCGAGCLAGEHLPPAKQPAIEITTAVYPSADAAYNAFVRLGTKGRNAEQDPIVGKAPGVCYQTDFYPPDKGTDWACTFSKGKTMVVVRTVITKSEVSTISISRAIAKNI